MNTTEALAEIVAVLDSLPSYSDSRRKVKTYLSARLAGRPTLNVAVEDKHRERAEEIAGFITGLAFKPLMGRDLTKFEQAALDVVNSNQFDGSKIGLLASLPEIYEQHLEQEHWNQRELELVDQSEFVGDELEWTRRKIRVSVEHTVNIKTFFRESQLICGVDADNNIIKFFWNKSDVMVNDKSQVINKGDILDISGRVKEHRINKMGSRETMMNYIILNAVNGHILEEEPGWLI